MADKSTRITRGVGKRAHRSASIKIGIFRALTAIAGKRQLDEISVDEICAHAGISKVTFFRYFPKKEDVLFYYIRIWCFNRGVEISNDGTQGMKGVYYLFDKMSATHERYPGLVMSILSAIAAQKRPTVPMMLKLSERQMLASGKHHLDKIQILSLPQLLEKFLLDAIMNREIRNVGDTRDLSLLFLSLLYGTLLARHNRSMESVQSEYRRNITFLLNGIKERPPY